MYNRVSLKLYYLIFLLIFFYYVSGNELKRNAVKLLDELLQNYDAKSDEDLQLLSKIPLIKYSDEVERKDISGITSGEPLENSPKTRDEVKKTDISRITSGELQENSPTTSDEVKKKDIFCITFGESQEDSPNTSNEVKRKDLSCITSGESLKDSLKASNKVNKTDIFCITSRVSQEDSPTTSDEVKRKDISRITCEKLQKHSPNTSDEVKKTDISYITSAELQENSPNTTHVLLEDVVNKWLQPGSNEKSIAIVGRKESGKTQLMKKILEKIRQIYDYIFYVSLEYIDCSTKMNILEFLTHQSTLRWINWKTDGDFQLFKRVVETLICERNQSNEVAVKQNPNEVPTIGTPDKVCIIFDDFEKSNFDFNTYRFVKSIYETVEAGYLVSNILRAWFSNAKKIVISDVWQFFQLPEHDSFRVVYIQGVDYKRQIRTLSADSLKTRGNEKSCEQTETSLKHYSENHTAENCSLCKSNINGSCDFELQSLCCTPTSYKQLIQLKSSPPITTACKILFPEIANAVQCNISGQNYSLFDKISSFAWKNYLSNRFLFQDWDLRELALSKSETVAFFFCNCEDTPVNFGKCHLIFFFHHVLAQEILAALWLASRPPHVFKAETTAYRKLFLEGKFAVVCEIMEEIFEPEFLQTCQKICCPQKENLEILKNLIGRRFFY